MVRDLPFKGSIDHQKLSRLSEGALLGHWLQHQALAILCDAKPAPLVKAEACPQLLGDDEASDAINGNYVFHLPIVAGIWKVDKRAGGAPHGDDNIE